MYRYVPLSTASNAKFVVLFIPISMVPVYLFLLWQESLLVSVNKMM